MNTDIKKFYVNSTKDYDMFKFLDTNRLPNNTILKKLEKSIVEHGVQIPIIVTDDKYIVDGQHRFWILRKLGYTVPYIVSKVWKDDKHTIEINNTGSRWNALDFANYAAESGNLDVQEALKIADKWYKETQKRLRRITTLEILMEGRSHSGLRTHLKNMTYKIDRDRGFQVYETLFEIDNYEIQGSPFAARMVRAVKTMNYDHDDLDEQVIALMCKDNYIRIFNSENDQLDYLNDLYLRSKEKLDKITTKN